jgi:uncharacterized protein (TIGR00297 family)
MLWLRGSAPGGLEARRLFVGLAASLVVSQAARRRGWLSPSGALGAVLTGALIVGAGGLTWGALLIVFFVLSSLLSRLRRRRAARPAGDTAKGAIRDLGQVLANGGAATLLALTAAAWPAPGVFAAYVGALSAVTADTWASELGMLSRRPPRLLTTGRVVPPGVDGGVTALGLLASLAGGLTIGMAALLLAPLAAGLGEPTLPADRRGWLPLIGLLAGLGGSLFDSLLGATVQAAPARPANSAESGRPRGWPWLDNDRVNLLASLAGAALGIALWLATA